MTVSPTANRSRQTTQPPSSSPLRLASKRHRTVAFSFSFDDSSCFTFVPSDRLIITTGMVTESASRLLSFITYGHIGTLFPTIIATAPLLCANRALVANVLPPRSKYTTAPRIRPGSTSTSTRTYTSFPVISYGGNLPNSPIMASAKSGSRLMLEELELLLGGGTHSMETWCNIAEFSSSTVRGMRAMQSLLVGRPLVPPPPAVGSSASSVGTSQTSPARLLAFIIMVVASVLRVPVPVPPSLLRCCRLFIITVESKCCCIRMSSFGSA
mmetsp:Transcript_25918/g.31773  ORF Transcript_25918/g.31773 Transcript_25918/m.31773 type:complete len:269 (-) Transcript_25918:378-1184(-)